MKTIYFINLDNDLGEIWLDENQNPLKYIHSNDANWRGEYHGFIIIYLGGELIELEPDLNDKDYDKLGDCCGDLEAMWKIIKKKI